MALFNPSRNEVRDFFFNSWNKLKQEQPLSDIEKVCVEVIHMHPEYQAVLDTPDKFRHLEYFPETGETNPFLHMSLHLSIHEQLSIDQPIGIRKAYQQLKKKYNDEHKAQHDVLDCLAETIWQAQQNKSELDSAHYLELLQQKVKAK